MATIGEPLFFTYDTLYGFPITKPEIIILPVDELQVAGLENVAVIIGKGFIVTDADAVLVQVPRVAITV